MLTTEHRTPVELSTEVRPGPSAEPAAAGVIGRKIIFINHFFAPDESATSQILSDLAAQLSIDGERVQVITSRQLYGDPGARLAAREQWRGIDVRRVLTTRAGRNFLPGRALDYLTFYLMVAFALVRNARRGDVVVAKTDPPMLSFLIFLLSKVGGFTCVNWLQDLYPEIAYELGILSPSSMAGRALKSVRNRSLSHAAINVVVGSDMASRLRLEGLSVDKLTVIENWADDGIVPVDRHANPLRRTWSLGERIVVGYSGNLGRAHDFETIIEAADQFRERSDIVFLIIGGGANKTKLEAAVRERRLGNFIFLPYQPREVLASSLGAADVHWLSLRPGLDDLIVPSKFYGIAAAGRPAIVIGSKRGELSRLIAEYQCGYDVSVGDVAALVQAISDLAVDADLRRRTGANARRMFDERFSRRRGVERWRDTLNAVRQ